MREQSCQCHSRVPYVARLRVLLQHAMTSLVTDGGVLCPAQSPMASHDLWLIHTLSKSARSLAGAASLCRLVPRTEGYYWGAERVADFGHSECRTSLICSRRTLSYQRIKQPFKCLWQWDAKYHNSREEPVGIRLARLSDWRG